MKKFWVTLSAALFALILVGCGDPSDFDDMPEEGGGTMQEGGGTGSGDAGGF